jgi:antirestriction protein ArdC
MRSFPWALIVAFRGSAIDAPAAFCCASLGIVPSVRHADYLGAV